MSKLFCLTAVNGPTYSISQVVFPGQLYVLWKWLCTVKMIKGSGLCGVRAKRCLSFAKLGLQRSRHCYSRSQEVNEQHQDHISSVWPWFCQNNLCWQIWYDILSVLGYSANESSIITSLMGLEWGQSFMTLCFIALPEISVLKWEGCRYFLWSYFLTRGCLWLMAFSCKVI